ncbi:uncharacterized protein PAC_15927 [Phialocephala subalpina]|uniref:Uncharacterized protein n=1 Tax=Phialocephala subalpina TaxID=576137 RepID=A0A1L7XM56_9HELO|nr:uncharacterized protein PAC_15927 [Phialocephala subalpina]
MELSVGEAKADPSPISSVPTAVTLDEENDTYSMGSLTKVLDNGNTLLPQVLVSLALEEEQELDFEQCRRWLQNFPALAMYAKVQGMYKSNSTLLILSVPVVIWDWIPDDPACAFIGFVYSQDLLEWRTDKKGQLSNVLPRSTTSSITTDNPSLPKPTSPHSNIANEKRVQQELFHPDIKDELSLKMPANPLQGVEALVTAVRNLTSNDNYKVAANIFDEILQLREQLKSKDAELGRAQKEIIGLKSKHESRVQERSDVSKIIDENGDLEGRIASLWKAKETEIASLRLAKDSEIAALQSAKAKLQSDNATLQSEKDVLKKEFGEQYKSWDIRISKQKDLKDEVAALKQLLEQENQRASASEATLADKKEVALDGTWMWLKSCENTLEEERQELELEYLDLNDLLVRRFFLTKLTESENLTWKKISGELYQPDLIKIIPKKFPLSNSIQSQYLRMAVAEKIIAMIYYSDIFQQYYLPESDETGKILNQLYKENPRREAIFRSQLRYAYKPEVEQGRVTSIVKSATDKVVGFLGPLLFAPNAEVDFRSEFEGLLWEAVDLWRPVQRSAERGFVENEPDNGWDDYEEYHSAIELRPDQEVHVPDEPSAIMSLFPRVIVDNFPISPGYALWSNQSTVVAADLESKSRNSMNELAGNSTRGIQRRGTRRFSSSGENTPQSPRSPLGNLHALMHTKNRSISLPRRELSGTPGRE